MTGDCSEGLVPDDFSLLFLFHALANKFLKLVAANLAQYKANFVFHESGLVPKVFLGQNLAKRLYFSFGPQVSHKIHQAVLFEQGDF